MNCANHPDIEKVAFCRTCGKPLCANCTRSVNGVIYCESCLAARLEGVQPNVAPPVAGFVPASSGGRSDGGEVRILLWQAFWPASFPSASAPSTPGNMPKDWRTW